MKTSKGCISERMDHFSVFFTQMFCIGLLLFITGIAFGYLVVHKDTLLYAYLLLGGIALYTVEWILPKLKKSSLIKP